MKPSKLSLSIREIVLFAMLGALTFALTMAMAALPNIEPVTLTLMVYGAVFGLKALYPMYVYVVMEFLFYGINTWSICYLYIWLILLLVTLALRKMEGALSWALLSGIYGLAFGALCAPVDVFIGGFGYAFAKWTSGIPFDIAHCAGNFVIALILFSPLRKLMQKLYARLES